MSKRIAVKREISDIFPGLPEDLGIECLLRVPCTSFFNLRAVCRSWRSVMNNPLFYQERKRVGEAEDLLVIVEVFAENCPTLPKLPCFKLTVYHSPSNTYGKLPPIPTESGSIYDYQYGTSHCVPFGHRLILTGLRVDNMASVRATFVYDFCSCRWQRGTNMLVGRWGFSCALDSINGLIYIAGGMDKDGNMVLEPEVYNVEEDQWSLLPPMPTDVILGSTAFVNGKFFILSGNLYSEPAQVYDSYTTLWTSVNFERVDLHVPEYESLYFFECYKFGDYNMYESEVRVIGLFTPGLEVVECAKLWYDKIFVSENVSQDMVFKLYELSTEEPGCSGWTTVKRRKPMLPLIRKYFGYVRDYTYCEFSVAHMKI